MKHLSIFAIIILSFSLGGCKALEQAIKKRHTQTLKKVKKLKKEVKKLKKEVKEQKEQLKTWQALCDKPKAKPHPLHGKWHIISRTNEVKYRMRVLNLEPTDDSGCHSYYSGTIDIDMIRSVMNRYTQLASAKIFKLTDCGFGATVKPAFKYHEEEVTLSDHPTWNKGNNHTYIYVNSILWEYELELEDSGLTMKSREFKTKKCTWGDWRKWRCRVGKKFTTTQVVTYVLKKE